MSSDATQANDAAPRYRADTSNQEVRLGYKKTEAGVIPGDWETRRLGELGQCLIGLTYDPSNVKPDGLLVLRSSNVGDSSLQFDDNVFVDIEVPDRIIVRKHDLLICVRNGSRPLIGKCALIDGRAEGMTFGAFMAVFRSPYNDFVAYCFQSDLIKRQIHEHLGATINQITNKSLNSFAVPFPAPPEQRAIAEALSDVDGLVGALEALIAEKRAIKQAAMQRLLTGKTRLPGFSGSWETKRLGEIGDFLKGSGVKRDEARSGNVACVRYGEIYTTHHDYIRTFDSWISPEVATAATRLEYGDILFAGSGETKGEIGKCVAFVSDVEAYAGGDIVILRPKGVDPLFLGYALNVPYVARQKISLGQGDAVVHISATALAQVSVALPSVKEQSAIATVLSDMDAQIAALERRRDKTGAIKQGMMQQLLTGRVRLVKPEAQAPAPQADAEGKAGKPHSWAFNEAVVIATLAKHFSKKAFPLGRKRYTKLAYLLHRHAEGQVDGYLKKAAGPYNPKTKYGGPERIALRSGYVREHKNGPYSGFVAADNADQAEGYFEKWYGPEAIQWLEQFRFKKNDELELLATVDMAAEELRASGMNVDVATVKDLIGRHSEWEAKLDRAAFSDANVAEAIQQSERLFRSSGEGSA